MLDVTAWSGLQLIERIADGNRNEVWRGELDGASVAVRRSRRSAASLRWELNLIEHLDRRGFVVPNVITTDAGASSHESVVVQRWIEGRPPSSEAEWRRVADHLQQLHQLAPNYPQRPECCTVLELHSGRRSVDADLDALPVAIAQQLLDVFAEFADAPISLIHGDLNPSNIRLGENYVALLDWDESRVDISWHDLSNLGCTVLDAETHARAERLSNAWEAVNAWIEEPEYARRRLAKLQDLEAT